MTDKLIVKKVSDARVDIEIHGKIDSDDMREGLDELIRVSQDMENGQMLYRITDFQFPTFGALGVELSHFPALFKLIGKFDRVAVLADQWWIQKASALEGALIPGMEIKTFASNDADSAEAWLSE